MRSFLTAVVLITTSFVVQAQQNYGIAYQAVARDADGDALESVTLDVRFNLMDGTDAVVWTETHAAITTDEFGLINLTIGSVEGTAALAQIDWSTGGYAFQVDVNSGNGFAAFGALAVSSVPVSLFALSAPEPKSDSLAAVVAQEMSDRSSADTGLQGQIDSNDTDISTNATAISDESAARIGADTGLQGQIDSNDMDISTNATAISDESSARAAADTGLQGQIDGNDTDIAANTTSIATNATAISDESSARTNADSDLQGQINDEETARFNNDAFLSGMIGANGTADAALEVRVSSLEGLSSSAAFDAVDSLDTAHSSEILSNTTSISNEVSDRTTADSNLQGQIDGNDTDIAANTTSIGTNATAISDENSARTTAVSGLQGQIDSNEMDIYLNAGTISTNASGISTNAGAISAETTQRSAADVHLQDQIDNLPNSVPSISGVVEDMLDGTQDGAGLNSDGSYFTNTAANYISTATSLSNADDLLDAATDAVQLDVDANELASDNAETALSGRIDALEADPTTATAVASVQSDVNQNESDADAAILVNTNSIVANDYFDQTGAKLAAGAGETWSELETATGTFTSSASAGTLTIEAGAITDGSGAISFDDENLTTSGTLEAGASTLSSTLDVTGATEFDSSLGVDGNLRVGASGASKFSVDAASGAITTSGDLVMTNGTIVAGALQVSGATTLNTADVSTMSVSTTLTVPTPSFGAAAANKSYVDSHAATLPQAYSYTSNESYSGLGAVLDANGVTITVFGANLDAGTYKLHLDGAEVAVTVSNVSATSVAFILTDADIHGLTARTGLLAPQLSIDGISTGLNIFVNL